MKKIIIRLVLMFACSVGIYPVALAQGTSQVSLALMPAQFITVKGDAAKFRAVNWINDGYQWGIKQLDITGDAAKDLHVSFKASGIPNTLETSDEILITKDEVGYVQLNYDSFRKYYGTAGGLYPGEISTNNPLPLSAYRVGEDLFLDIGNLKVELGNKKPEETSLALYYERAFKNGSKNWLSWGDVKAQTAATVGIRKVAPTWQHLDQTTDTMGIKNKFKALGFNFKGDQKFEFYKGNTERPEVIYDATTSTTGSTNKIRNQKDADQTKSLSAAYLADRWTLNDQTYLAMGYRVEHSRVSQNELMREYNQYGVPALYSNPKNWDGYTRVTEDKNTVTGHIHTNISDNLSLSTKLKAEIVRLNGVSVEANDCGTGLLTCSSGTPDGIANYAYNGTNENKISSGAGSVGLKYSGISKTSIYSDFEFGQERNWKALERSLQNNFSGQTATTSNSAFWRETENNSPEWKGTIGTRVTPFKGVSSVLEYKHGDKNDKLRLITGSNPTVANLYKLTYGLRTTEDALSTRISWKPVRFLEGSFRAKQSMDVYRTQFASYDTIKTQGTSRDFVYALTLMPLDELMFNLSYSLQQNKISTPVSELAGTTYSDFLPVSTSNVDTWELASSYAPTANLSFFNVLSYSRSQNGIKNHNLTSATTSAFAYDNDEVWYNADMGVKLALKNDWSVEPHYAYYSFRTKDSVTFGNYTANVMWFDITKKW